MQLSTFSSGKFHLFPGKPKFDPPLGINNVGQFIPDSYSGAAKDNAETIAEGEGFQAPQVKQRDIPYMSGP